MPESRSTSGSHQSIWLAMGGSAAMLAHQVAGKAARDGFFLQHFEPSDLPKMVVVAALVSLGMAIGFARLSERFGPARLVPLAFVLSAALHAIEWFGMRHWPGPVTVFFYLHVVGLGAILLSGFWLLLSEVFDLREAKRYFGRVAGMGTAGGIAGGILAERMVAYSMGDHLLLLLGFWHAVCAGIAVQLHPPTRHHVRSHENPSMAEAFQRTPLLWQLATLVLLGTCTAAMLDYLFKLGASMAFGRGPELVQYFAFYYTGCQILTFLLQTFLAKPAVERLGVAKSVASLPVMVGVGSTAALLIPVYPLVVALRATEVILRGSLFRSGYEFLYTPVPPADKRAVKTIVDVGFDRMGDAVGAGAVQLMIWLGPALARPEILGLAMVLAAVSTTMALRLESSYRGVLERGLVERAREEDDSIDEPETILNTLFEGTPSLVELQTPAETKRGRKPAPPAPPTPLDFTTERLIELRSRDRRRVLAALAADGPWDPLLVPQVIRLLAWDEVSAAARQYLERGRNRILGQLMDALTDQDLDFSIRRRLPRLMARVGTQQSVDGLVEALLDPRFEIRYQAGRALEYLKRRHPELDFRPRAIMDAAGRELAVSRAIWVSRRDAKSPVGDIDEFLDEVLQNRADRSLEHVFSLFAIVLPREPLMAAFRALHQDDKMFRGLALEYLETMLPEEIRQRLWQVIEESPPAPATPNDSELVRALLESNRSLLLQLKPDAAVFPPEQGGHPKPGQRQSDVDPGEAGEPER